MYLKRIEAIGFKSFADKTVIQFESGVTAVVGPNGSGKSNISDSIRWVLGEQSAKSLRGGKMEDIIFAGTGTRKPLNFAEVTLVLDNSAGSLPVAYEEVSITRRVYRSGDSEYLINKQRVRLKDVVDLIMDTGIGYDSLSIISQDKVKAIVEARVEDRRIIIEEAAGVLKYKVRKKEALRKLQTTNDNLERVGDIIFELEDQVEPLREQSEQAEKYIALKEEATDLEISILAHDIKRLDERLRQTDQEKKELEFEQVSLEAKIRTDEEKREQLKEEQQEQNQLLEQLQTELVKTSELIQQLQGRRDVLEERQKNATAGQEQLAVKELELKAGLEQIASQLKEIEITATATRNNLIEKQEQLTEKTASYHHLEENLKEQLEAIRNQFFEDQSRLTNTKSQHETNREQIKRLELAIQQNEQEQKELLANQAAFSQELQAFEEKYGTILNNLQEKRKAYEALNVQHESKKQAAKVKADEYQQLIQKRDKTKNRLQWLEDATKDFSGFNDGVKKILQAREQKAIAGIEGAVAELVKIPQELELAMEVILGSAMQQIVTTTDEFAKTAIEYLKQNRAGRATFLPLNVIKSRLLPGALHQQLAGEADVVGIASLLVTYDERYALIFENLLGNIIVTKHLDAANQLAKKLNYRYRIVTLAGDVVGVGGAMTGGAIKRQGSSLLRQKNEMIACREQLEALDQEIREAKTMWEALEENVNADHHQLLQVQAASETLREQVNELNQEKIVFDYRQRDLLERKNTLTTNEGGFATSMSELVRQNHQLAETRVRLEEQIEAAKLQIEDLEAQLSRQEELKAELMQIVTNLRIEVVKLEAALQHEEATWARLLEENVQTKKDLEELVALIASSKEELVDRDDLVKQLEEEALAAGKERENITEEIQKRRLDLARVGQNVEHLEREIRESRKVYQTYAHRANEAAVLIGKIDVEMDLMLKKIEEEHQMTVTYASEHYPLKEAPAAVKKRLERLKVELSYFKDVNTGAIAEYQRVKERYEFLTTERDDLIGAIKNLEATIDEMDGEMIVKFKETFELVRKHYIEIFKKLFNGGVADLILTDPDDLLTTGIEIIANPPGTNLKTSNLLSGGQKSLTSIALLFAILKVRTVPFCVLDEVEAALDESNVIRYAKYLKAFSEETQFIVITHRKGTMENADILYGVTMQERGVTKLVSVRMENVSNYLEKNEVI